MSQHDYNIVSDTAPAARADINNVLAAIVSQNSGAAEPTSTFANMIWYDSSANILKMRNEADNAWITLSTLDQSANTAAAPVAFASTAEAEAGTDTTKTMNAARVKESIEARQLFAHLVVGSYAFLINNTTSNMIAGLSYAGTSLQYNVVVTNGGWTTTTNAALPGSAAAGTWRCMGSTVRGYYQVTGGEGAVSKFYTAGLFIRTA
tara:strand:- start:1490 stop:2107 length:618 start_codon:yes stop_codon:yes gene_type:complete